MENPNQTQETRKLRITEKLKEGLAYIETGVAIAAISAAGMIAMGKREKAEAARKEFGEDSPEFEAAQAAYDKEQAERLAKETERLQGQADD